MLTCCMTSDNSTFTQHLQCNHPPCTAFQTNSVLAAEAKHVGWWTSGESGTCHYAQAHSLGAEKRKTDIRRSHNCKPYGCVMCCAVWPRQVAVDAGNISRIQQQRTWVCHVTYVVSLRPKGSRSISTKTVSMPCCLDKQARSCQPQQTQEIVSQVRN